MRLLGNRICVAVRPSVEGQLFTGHHLGTEALRGRVIAVGPDVNDIEIQDEVWFERPEGTVPDIAFLHAGLVLGVLQSTW